MIVRIIMMILFLSCAFAYSQSNSRNIEKMPKKEKDSSDINKPTIKKVKKSKIRLRRYYTDRTTRKVKNKCSKICNKNKK